MLPRAGSALKPGYSHHPRLGLGLGLIGVIGVRTIFCQGGR